MTIGRILISIVLMLMFFSSMDLRIEDVSIVSKSSGNVFVAVMLHYDTYYSSINLTRMHLTFEGALSYLQNERFPMDRILVVTWRNTLDSEGEFSWLMDALERYDVPVDDGRFGLYMAPEDTHDSNVLTYALETFRYKFGRYPFFVAGMSASSNTYLKLVDYGVKLSFFNLWEEGEDYSCRGYRTGDGLLGANWEGSPFQPYKPSRRTANAPGLTGEDELDIWEAHWITRNPSYAFTVINSRNWGSIHPLDLLWGDWLGSRVCSPSQALEKFRVILDLIDFNSRFNPLVVVSYPVEVSLLGKNDVFEVWQASMQEFIRRGYRFVDAVGLRNVLDSLNAEPPHTPIYVWVDTLTSSDFVIAGEHTPFALLSSPYGRFIYARRDPLSDAGTPLVSTISYTTARAHNEFFQSVRELTGVGDFKLNTFVNGMPVDMRWFNDIANITIAPGKAIAIRWVYTKGEVPYIDYDAVIYLTPYGVLLEKDVTFTRSVTAGISTAHYLTVQGNSPTPFTEGGVRVETDMGDGFQFSSTNFIVVERQYRLNDTLMFTARDGYGLGVTLVSGRPSMVRIFDEAGEAPFQTLEFTYNVGRYEVGDRLQLSYTLTPARNVKDARELANAIKTLMEGIKSDGIPIYTINLKDPTIEGRLDGLRMGLLTLMTSIVTLVGVLLLNSRFSQRARVKTHLMDNDTT